MSALDPIVAVFDEHAAAGTKDGLHKANAAIKARWPKLSDAEYAAAWQEHFQSFYSQKLDAQFDALIDARLKDEATIGGGGEFVGDMGESLWTEYWKMREDILGEKRN